MLILWIIRDFQDNLDRMNPSSQKYVMLKSICINAKGTMLYYEKGKDKLLPPPGEIVMQNVLDLQVAAVMFSLFII